VKIPKAKKQSKANWQNKKLDDYIKEGLPILPELQFKYKPPLDTVSPQIRRRIELLSRAYSAAVYAHKNQLTHFQKEQILNAFNTECFTVLQGVSEAVEFAKGNPVAERHSLLKDYQSWVNQVADLLKEGLYALNYDKWVQRFVAIPPGDALSRKNGRLQLTETFLNVLGQRLKVLEPDLYLSKFNKLFLCQMQLEQRISLAIGITGDWIAFLIALRNRKRQAETGAGKTKPKTKRGRHKKYTSAMAKQMHDMYEQCYEKSNDAKGSWNAVAKFYVIKTRDGSDYSGKAAEMACRRCLHKQNK
jgi:hypothetical protein